MVKRYSSPVGGSNTDGHFFIPQTRYHQPAMSQVGIFKKIA